MRETRPRRVDATMVARVCFDFVEPAQEECSLVIGLPMYGTFELSTFFPRSSLARVHARVHPMNVNYASVRTARQLSFYSFYLSLINRIPCILYIYIYIYSCAYICIFVAMQFRNHNRATQSSLRYYATSCHSNVVPAAFPTCKTR